MILRHLSRLLLILVVFLPLAWTYVNSAEFRADELIWRSGYYTLIGKSRQIDKYIESHCQIYPYGCMTIEMQREQETLAIAQALLRRGNTHLAQKCLSYCVDTIPGTDNDCIASFFQSLTAQSSACLNCNNPIATFFTLVSSPGRPIFLEIDLVRHDSLSLQLLNIFGNVRWVSIRGESNRKDLQTLFSQFRNIEFASLWQPREGAYQLAWLSKLPKLHRLRIARPNLLQISLISDN